MKIQIYAAIFAFVFIARMGMFCEESVRHGDPICIEKAWDSIAFVVFSMPLLGRIWGWW
jgi:hypothetical protein